MSKHIKEFWNGLAMRSPREGVVGHYQAHMDDPNEADLLFRAIGEDAVGTNKSVALDFGCGPARNIMKFKDWFARIDGVDVSDVILKEARRELEEAGIPIPNLYETNGYTLDGIDDSVYDVVFSIICLQHVSSHDWRTSLFNEFFRVLKPGGRLTFQMGFGPGHPISVEYTYNFSDNETTHRDVRVEDPNDLVNDLTAVGFSEVYYTITDPCNDQHPKWIWVRAKKP